MTKRESQVKCAFCGKTITKKEKWLHLYVYGSLDRDYYEKISNKIVGPEDFIKKSFEFLLKRVIRSLY